MARQMIQTVVVVTGELEFVGGRYDPWCIQATAFMGAVKARRIVKHDGNVRLRSSCEPLGSAMPDKRLWANQVNYSKAVISWGRAKGASLVVHRPADGDYEELVFRLGVILVAEGMREMPLRIVESKVACSASGETATTRVHNVWTVQEIGGD